MWDGPAEDVERARTILVRAVAKICPGWLSNRSDDIVQNALIRVLKMESGKGSALPGPSYLWRVAHSATVDEIRRQKRHLKEEPLESETGMSAQPLQFVAQTVQEDPELRRALRHEIEQLMPSRRIAVLLQVYGFSLKESARILGRSAKSVENLRYLGMQELRRRLKDQGLER